MHNIDIIFLCLVRSLNLYYIFRRYLIKSPEDQDEDLPSLEDDAPTELDLNVLGHRRMAAAAERLMQNQQHPAP